MNCGARGLKTVVDSVINKYMYDILSRKVSEIRLTYNDIYDNGDDEKSKLPVKKLSIM